MRTPMIAVMLVAWVTGNAPAAYFVIPNSVQLDQATLYIQRVPDTVQTDHFDWEFPESPT